MRFLLTGLLIIVAIELAGRAIFSAYGAEPWYDHNGDWLKLVLMIGPFWWSYRYFGVHQRLRERGHIR